MPERLARLTPDRLDPDQRAVYDQIAGGPRATGPQLFALAGPDGALNGPFNAFLLSPEVGGPMQALGGAVRYGTRLTGRVRELAILIVAAHWESAFERYAHEAVGRHAGLTEAELVAVRTGAAPQLDDVQERVAVELVRALVQRQDLDDEEYATGTKVLGERAVFELTALVGYYSTLALQLRVYRVSVRDPLTAVRPGSDTASAGVKSTIAE